MREKGGIYLNTNEVAETGKSFSSNDSSNVATTRLETLKLLSRILQHEINVLVRNNSPNLENGKINLANEVLEYEKDLIRTVMIKMGGNQRRAAKFLGTKPSTLNAKIIRHRINF